MRCTISRTVASGSGVASGELLVAVGTGEGCSDGSALAEHAVSAVTASNPAAIPRLSIVSGVGLWYSLLFPFSIDIINLLTVFFSYSTFLIKCNSHVACARCMYFRHMYTNYMNRKHLKRQINLLFVLIIAGLAVFLFQGNSDVQPVPISDSLRQEYFGEQSALETLEALEVKGRAPKTGYQRSQFGSGWASQGGCDMRNIILKRDMPDTKLDDQCHVLSGTLNDPYTSQVINFTRGPDSSQKVQIDHVVALSDAWQKGAQQLTAEDRASFANDPLNLLAVDGSANQTKGDGDAATWLPPNKQFRCQYVARQVAVKKKYNLWVTEAERRAIERILTRC